MSSAFALQIQQREMPHEVMRLRGGWDSVNDKLGGRQDEGSEEEGRDWGQLDPRTPHQGVVDDADTTMAECKDGIRGVVGSEDPFHNPMQFSGWKKGWVRAVPAGPEGWEGDEADLHTASNASLECIERRCTRRTGLPLKDRAAALILALAIAQERDGAFEPTWLEPLFGNCTLQASAAQTESDDDGAPTLDPAVAKLLAKRILPAVMNFSVGICLGRNVLLTWQWPSESSTPCTHMSDDCSCFATCRIANKGHSNVPGLAHEHKGSPRKGKHGAQKARDARRETSDRNHLSNSSISQNENELGDAICNISDMNEHLCVQLRFNGTELWPSDEALRSRFGMSMWLRNTMPGSHTMSMRSVQQPLPGLCKTRYGPWCSEINITVGNDHSLVTAEAAKVRSASVKERQTSLVERWIRKYAPDYMMASELMTMYMSGLIPAWVLERSGLGNASASADGTDTDIKPELIRARRLSQALRDVKQGYKKIIKWNSTLEVMKETDPDLYAQATINMSLCDFLKKSENESASMTHVSCVKGSQVCQCRLFMVCVPGNDTMQMEGRTMCMQRVPVREYSDGYFRRVHQDDEGAVQQDDAGAVQQDDECAVQQVDSTQYTAAYDDKTNHGVGITILPRRQALHRNRCSKHVLERYCRHALNKYEAMSNTRSDSRTLCPPCTHSSLLEVKHLGRPR